MIEKVVKVEAKAGLQHAFYIQEIDNQALWRKRPAYITAAKVQTPGLVIKDPRIEELKPKTQDF